MFVTYYRKCVIPWGFTAICKWTLEFYKPEFFAAADSLWVVPGTLED